MARSVSKPTAGQVWQQVLAGDATAYQTVVENHQSAVAAVAYSILGDFGFSQDVAQETFWVAWTRRNSLRDASRLGSWLCGIARNLARQARRQMRRLPTVRAAETGHEPVADVPDPLVKSVADEEHQLVWSALEQVPEKYREVVTLYYRQGQSIAEVAVTAGISEEAARQRLSRGRSMLRGRVSRLIEDVLERSKPDAGFTARVMAGIVGAGVAGKTAGAAASVVSLESAGAAAGGLAAAAKGAVTGGAAAGLLGGAAGSAGGLLGGWMGIWLPAQLAPTETERQLVLERGRVVMRASLLFTLAVVALSVSFVGFRFFSLYFAGGLLALTLAYTVFLIVQSLQTAALVRDLRTRVSVETDPNQSAFRARFVKETPARPATRRSWTSPTRFLGLPLVDIQMLVSGINGPPAGHPAVARGWIAIGDRAWGILFAAGGIARGGVAVGGVCVGVVALGGLGCGVLSLGGLVIGGLAVGGVAAGWDAVGGLAAGWHSAVGGVAFAWHAAMGGFAMAGEFAVGGEAIARESNTEWARTIVHRDSWQGLFQWIMRNQWGVVGGALLVCLPPVFLFRRLVSWLESTPLPAAASRQADAGSAGTDGQSR